MRAAVLVLCASHLGGELGAVPVQPVDLAGRQRFVGVRLQVFQ